MAGKYGSNDRAGKEGPLELVGMILAVFAVMIVLVWLAASAKIVYYFTPPLRLIGSTWEWLPGDFGVKIAASVYKTSRAFLERPADVSFFSFMGFMNTALQPLTTLLVLFSVIFFIATLMRPSVNVFRRFKNADDLLRGMSYTFTGTAPILHIRKDLANHTDPRWARQRFPIEVLKQEKFDGKALLMKDPENPSQMKPNYARLEQWFMGLPPERLRKPGRQVSATLGVQMVDLTDPSDRKLFEKMPSDERPTFSDRFSDVGKVMFGMLCAHAYGGMAGVKDAHRARDQLNNSCRGAKHGMPNLTVAEWIFTKYRCNELAHKLFAIHHWEHTYLFELFAQAKRRGKFTDGEFRWLKPTNRIMFYTLNTVGRFTPHTESAAAFNHHAFERKCAREKLWPLRLREDGKSFEHVIFVKGAVEAMELEWDRWVNGIDESDDEWWKDRASWVSRETALSRVMQPVAPPPDTEAARQMANTSFDDQQSAARRDAEERAKKEQAAALAALDEVSQPPLT